MAKETKDPDQTDKRTGIGEAASPGDRELPENSKEALDRRLDEAGEESFPDSDPVSVIVTR